MTIVQRSARTSKGDRFIRSFFDFENGTVSRELYVNEDIFQMELEQIFSRCWLFIGHESMVPNPGDFVVTRMGTEEVLLVRDRKDHQIRAFLNSCRHRGEKVCRYDAGNGLVFTCPFHAWTYDTTGKLVAGAGHNDPTAYNGELNKADWGLVEVGKFKNFHGSLWATWDKKAPDFEEYLGPWAESVRYMLEASDGEEAGLEVFTPFQKHRIPTNWKVAAFTDTQDTLHAAMTHRSVNAAAIGPMRDRGDGDRSIQHGEIPYEAYIAGDHNLGHGGRWHDYLVPGFPEYVNTWMEEGVDDYFRETHNRRAQKYANRVMPPFGNPGGGHMCVWPSFLMDSWRWRYWHPHEVGIAERWSLFPMDKQAPKHVKDAFRHYVMRYNGPAGCTESDDMENWNYVWPASRGVMARKFNYAFKNGLGHGFFRDDVPGVLFNGGNTEETHRARYSRWLAFMEAESWDDLYPINPDVNHRVWPLKVV